VEKSIKKIKMVRSYKFTINQDLTSELKDSKNIIISKQLNSAKDLEVYKEAYSLAMEIYTLSKLWPAEEKFALIDQIRRSSRSVCTNLREAWAKRRYEAHFISKLTDADGENSETDTWLNFAKDCGYLKEKDYTRLTEKCRNVGKMLGSILKNPSSFLVKRSPAPDL